MNRILLTVLTISLLSAPALCQEQDTLLPRSVPDTLLPRSVPDTLLPRSIPDTLLPRPVADSTLYGEIPEYIPLWESDTVYEMMGTDTISHFRTAPRVHGDTAMVEPDFSHSPSRAIMLSLVLPGLGQGYNRKYYKIPIVWAAMGGAGYAIYSNTNLYRQYSAEYLLNPDATNERYVRITRRYMEMSYIAMIAVYALQVVDAYVDAQLYSWDVTENLSMGISPSLQPLMAPVSLTGYSYGLTCSFNMRRR
ncbi:MAG: hypothetical protein GY790_07660 [Bacteroidetes bacterium]|nr:hypothetical protein [Bacteroidota bacterium]